MRVRRSNTGRDFGQAYVRERSLHQGRSSHPVLILAVAMTRVCASLGRKTIILWYRICARFQHQRRTAGPTQERPSADVDGWVERERRNAFDRGADVAERSVGQAQSQVWGSNPFPTQFTPPAAQHQLCLSHQVRVLTDAVKVDGPAGSQRARELRHIFGRALRLHCERGRVTLATSTSRRVRIARAATG
jgi:hypothetical protein